MAVPPQAQAENDVIFRASTFDVEMPKCPDQPSLPLSHVESLPFPFSLSFPARAWKRPEPRSPKDVAVSLRRLESKAGSVGLAGKGGGGEGEKGRRGGGEKGRRGEEGRGGPFPFSFALFCLFLFSHVRLVVLGRGA